MFCYNCGEENPDEAKFCRNCGAELKEQTVKKVEVIESPNSQNKNYRRKQTTTTSDSSSKDNDWIGCCLCIVAIFIVFAIIGSF